VYDETGARAFADVVISEAHAHSLPRERLCLAVTGTQGEPQAALARLARGDGELPVSLQRGDRVVLSARVIPGNELKLQAVLDDLIDRGVDVVGGRRAPHVSGHGGQRDLQALLAATRPQTFVALHGTPQHLVAHGALARQGGLAAGAVVALRDGHTLELSREGHRHIESGKAHEPAVVDGEVCDFPRGIAATRLRLGQGGVVALTVRVDADGAAVVTVTTRGMFPPLSDDVRRALTDIVHERQARGLPLDDDDADRAYRRPWRKGYAPAPVVVVTRC
jgi:ribonuclease J